METEWNRTGPESAVRRIEQGREGQNEMRGADEKKRAGRRERELHPSLQFSFCDAEEWHLFYLYSHRGRNSGHSATLKHLIKENGEFSTPSLSL